MAIDLQRVNVKLYLADPAALTPEEAFRVFNRWIPETTDEVLVDAADYAHVGHGPRTVLVGHEANYVLDDTDGRLGLLYGRKSPVTGDNAERLRAALTAALKACRRLQADAEGNPPFAGGELAIIINDRLNAPNTDATLEALRADVDAALKQLYGGAAVRLERQGTERERFALRVTAEGEHSVDSLLENLAA